MYRTLQSTAQFYDHGFKDFFAVAEAAERCHNSIWSLNVIYQSDNESYNRAWYWNNSSEVSDSDEARGDNLGYGSKPE